MGRPPLTEVLLDQVRNMESFHLEIEGYRMYLFFGLGISYEECIIIGTKFKLYLMWSLPQCVNSVLLLLFFFLLPYLLVVIEHWQKLSLG